MTIDKAPLRISIEISDNSALKNVTMRNNFEHFDERIDRWWQESEGCNHFDLNVGFSSMMVGIENTDRFRSFDPIAADVYFWGDDFNVGQIIAEVQSLMPKLAEETAKPYWDLKP